LDLTGVLEGEHIIVETGEFSATFWIHDCRRERAFVLVDRDVFFFPASAGNDYIFEKRGNVSRE
jgi:hypothetical protein